MTADAANEARGLLKTPANQTQVKAETEPPEQPPAAPEKEPEGDEMTAPKYQSGDRVHCIDDDKNGVVAAQPMKTWCYFVKCDDGSSLMCMEHDIEPEKAAPKEAPAEDSLRAEVAGLKAQIKVLQDEKTAAIAKADADAKAAAFDASGVRADLRATIEQTVTRNEGETWTQAVDRDKAARPSAYASSEQPKQKTEVPTQAKIPGGMDIPKHTGAAHAETEIPSGNNKARYISVA